ncbi:hypothetical protein BMAGB8_A0322 [Burkholderia mallei GB8 horse 4]|nr:hypothetical protein BMAGB8_A0322 [Burkholderia mallei GB8 horse 4]
MRGRPDAKVSACRRARGAAGLGAERQAMRVMLRIRIMRTFGHDALLLRSEAWRSAVCGAHA